MLQPKSAGSRLLYPFTFGPDFADCLALLTASAWRRVPRDEAPHGYVEVLQQEAAELLFDKGAYLVPGTGIQNTFGNSNDVVFGGEVLGRVSFPSFKTPLELFLSPDGAGVLSLGFAHQGRELSCLGIAGLNYRLAQQYPKKSARILRRTGKDTPPDELNAWELVQAWLRPIQGRFAGIQERFGAFTVVVCDETVDFGDEATLREGGQLVSRLSRVEEIDHAPTAFAETRLLLNNRHLSEFTVQGGAELISEQFDGGGFDAQRYYSAMNRHFVPYLLALLQRGILLGIRPAVVATASISVQSRRPQVLALRDQLIGFRGRAQLPVISSRETISRQYRLARQVMEVAEIDQHMQDALEALEASDASRQTVDILHETHKGHEETQRIELLIVVVYATELAHVIGDGITIIPKLVYVEGASLGTLVIALLLLGFEKKVARFRTALLFGWVTLVLILGMTFSLIGHSEGEPAKKEAAQPSAAAGVDSGEKRSVQSEPK